MKRLVIILTLIVAVIASMAAFERDCDGMENGKQAGNRHFEKHEKGRMDQGENHIGRMLKELELTEDQQDKIATLQSNHKKKMIELKAEIEVLLVDKHDANKDHDFAKLKKLTSSVFEIKEDMAVKKIEHVEKIWNILTPGQQTKANEMKKDGHHQKKMMQKKKQEHNE